MFSTVSTVFSADGSTECQSPLQNRLGYVCYESMQIVWSVQVPVDLRGAGDDVVRMARALFSDRVRLLWSDTPVSAPAGGNSDSGGGRWPSPGAARRPLHIPWRLRHFLAYSRRPTFATPGHGVSLDSMLVQFKEVGCHALTTVSETGIA